MRAKKILGVLALLTLVGVVWNAARASSVAVTFPAAVEVQSSVNCLSTHPLPLGVVPARHVMRVQPQFDTTAVWICAGPNCCTTPGCSYQALYVLDGGPTDAGYFCDAGILDAGPVCYDTTGTISYPICYNDGGYPNNAICYQDAGPSGPYFCDGGFTGPIDGGYCVSQDGGPSDAGYFCDGGILDAGPAACYDLTYSPLIDAGYLDAGPGVVGEEIAGGGVTELSMNFSTTYGSAPYAVWCLKNSGAQDGTRDGGWTSVTEQP